MRVGIIGSGQVGQAMAKGFVKYGYEVQIGSRSPEKLAPFSASLGIRTGTLAGVAEWAELVVLAVLGRGAEAALSECGADQLESKVVIDTTNPISDERPDQGVLRYFTPANDSLMEQLQRLMPAVRFVKAFNSVGHAVMIDPIFPEGRPTMFYCGNDGEAKAIVNRIISEFGWRGADMGGAPSARPIEALCQLWCVTGFLEHRWDDHAFHLMLR